MTNEVLVARLRAVSAQLYVNELRAAAADAAIYAGWRKVVEEAAKALEHPAGRIDMSQHGPDIDFG